ncbi:hypothetical protein FBZ98_11541 [Rhizobium sp. ERR 922]|uniref:hypothetical protein n=1 Tax=unclassified Rhizobium TaxID=2613769 RepID=UPI0011A25246|nr:MULTISPECIES: hypothetical protein [unclassified Rhizobium]TWB45571.1 hypothetical protein FBZ98_11541 [Rhizobium sp. ERR 922]TWB88193.1 hypothetical protein FBZ97_11416 [Rhizobium sp. ERR 942]
MGKTIYLISAAFLLGLVGDAFAACTVPNQIVNGGVVDSAPVMGNFNAVVSCIGNTAPAGAQNSVQLDNDSGGFAAVGPLTDGQLLIGTSGSPPSAATLSAGTGIAITNSPGGISIATTGVLGGGGADWLNGTAVVKPVASNFTLQTSTTPPTGAAIAGTGRGMVLSTTAAVNGAAMMAEMTAPSGHWQATMLGVYTGGLSDYSMPSIAVRDAVNNKAVEFGITAYGLADYRFDYFITSGGIGLDGRVNDIMSQDGGFPQPAQPIWQRLTYDGSNLIWSFSRDGEFFIPAYSVPATAVLSNLSTVGPAVIFPPNIRQTWAAAFHVLSWSVVSL